MVWIEEIGTLNVDLYSIPQAIVGNIESHKGRWPLDSQATRMGALEFRVQFVLFLIPRYILLIHLLYKGIILRASQSADGFSDPANHDLHPASKPMKRSLLHCSGLNKVVHPYICTATQRYSSLTAPIHTQSSDATC
jgi:hypothetical protein